MSRAICLFVVVFCSGRGGWVGGWVGGRMAEVLGFLSKVIKKRGPRDVPLGLRLEWLAVPESQPTMVVGPRPSKQGLLSIEK